MHVIDLILTFLTHVFKLRQQNCIRQWSKWFVKLFILSPVFDYIVFVFVKVTVDLRGVFWGKQYNALCINGKYINLYIIAELI